MNNDKSVNTKEYLLHINILLPKIIIDKAKQEISNIKKIKLTSHCNSSIEDEICKGQLSTDDFGKIENFILEGIKEITNDNIFEIGIKVIDKKFFISKVCFRKTYIKENLQKKINGIDICTVVSIEKEKNSDINNIKTIWLNSTTDKHKTLKVDNYIKDEKTLISILT